MRSARPILVLLATALVVAAIVGCKPSGLGHFPLRHTFSLVPGLPGGSASTPTSCFGADGDYICRLVGGVEESGSKLNYTFPAKEALRFGTNAGFGSMVVRSNGSAYEGCVKIDGGRSWYCDYRVTKLVSRTHYTSTKRYVLRVFWAWQSYTRDQASCALGIASLWAKYTKPAFAATISDCANGPM